MVLILVIPLICKLASLHSNSNMNHQWKKLRYRNICTLRVDNYEHVKLQTHNVFYCITPRDIIFMKWYFIIVISRTCTLQLCRPMQEALRSNGHVLHGPLRAHSATSLAWPALMALGRPIRLALGGLGCSATSQTLRTSSDT
jgi:hypothetical protein